jgi:hypothetical protein
MLWSLKENAGGLNHMFKGLHRALFRIPLTRHFETLSKRSDKIRLLLDDDKNPVPCKACGYAVVRLIYSDGWEVEACSAITAPHLVGNQKFENWVESMPRNRVTSDIS